MDLTQGLTANLIPLAIVLSLVFGLPALIILLIYNGLIQKKNQVENSFATIDVQLKQRYDLIPNLVATAQTYMKFEGETLKNIVELRSRAMGLGPEAEDEKIQVNNEISRTLRSIMVSVENYPDLKSSEQFILLQRSLNEVEAQLAAARRTFNASVTDFNNSVEMFPSSVIASLMGYRRKNVLEISEAERKNVNVGQLFKNQ